MPADDAPLIEIGHAESGRALGLQAPCRKKIVLSARAPDRRLGLAVDIYFLIALAKPRRAAGAHRQHRADIVALARGFQHDIVPVLLHRIFLPILGMEIRRVLRHRVLFDPVDVIIQQRDGLVALVHDFDPHRLAERHPPVAVVGIAVLHDHRHADDLAALTEAVGEEIADRRLDRGPVVAIPEDAQQHFLVVGRALWCPPLRLGRQESEPQVGDDSGTCFIHQHVRCARQNLIVVPVAGLFEITFRVGFRSELPLGPTAAHFAHPHGRADPHRAPLLRPCQVFQGIGNRGLVRRQREQHEEGHPRCRGC